MKNISTLILLAAFLVPLEGCSDSTKCEAQITYLTNSARFATSATSVTSGSINTTGATLIVAACFGSTYPVSSVTNSGTADTWHTLSTSISSGNYIAISYAYAPTTSSSQTFTCSYSGTNGLSTIAATAFSGTMASSEVLDTYATGGELYLSHVAVGPITPSESGELFYVLAGNTDASITCTIPTVDSGFTQTGTTCGTYAWGIVPAYLISSSSSSIGPTITFTNSSGGYSDAIMAAFKPAAKGLNTIWFTQQ